MKLWIVLGYLGSGKTTFVRHFLDRFRDSDNAVVVNDFGARDVDGKILREACNEVREIYDGSIFCSCRSDQFAAAVIELSKKCPDHLIVEASGLANPAVMFRALEAIRKESACSVDFMGSVCLVDASNAERSLSVCHAVKLQIAMSDLILVNKTDLADAATIRRLTGIVRELNPFARVEFCTDARTESLDFPIVEKPEVRIVEDLGIQKCLLEFGPGISRSELSELSEKLSAFCHRIKGVAGLSQETGFAPERGTACSSEAGETGKKTVEYFLFEYVDGGLKLQRSDREENFAVLLACTSKNLKKLAEAAVADSALAGKGTIS